MESISGAGAMYGPEMVRSHSEGIPGRALGEGRSMSSSKWQMNVRENGRSEEREVALVWIEGV